MAKTSDLAHRRYEPPADYLKRLKCYNALLKLKPAIAKAALPEATIIRDPDPEEIGVIPRFTLTFEQKDPTPEVVTVVKERIRSIRDKIYLNYNGEKNELGVWLPLDAVEVPSFRERTAANSINDLLVKKISQPKQAPSSLPVPQEKTNNHNSNNLNPETMAKLKSDDLLLQKVKDHNKKSGFSSSKDYFFVAPPNKTGHVVVNCRNEASAKKMSHSYGVAGLADNVLLPEGKQVIHLWDGPAEGKKERAKKKKVTALPKTAKPKAAKKKKAKKKKAVKISSPKNQGAKDGSLMSLSVELRVLADRAEEVEQQQVAEESEGLVDAPRRAWEFLQEKYGNGGTLIFVTLQPSAPVVTLKEKQFIKGFTEYLANKEE